MEFLAFLLWLVYLAPWLVAEVRHREDATRILVANFAFGWTLLGWGATLYWALSDRSPARPAPRLRLIEGGAARRSG